MVFSRPVFDKSGLWSICFAYFCFIMRLDANGVLCREFVQWWIEHSQTTPPPPNMAVMVALKSVLETGNAHK